MLKDQITTYKSEIIMKNDFRNEYELIFDVLFFNYYRMQTTLQKMLLFRVA